MKKSKTFNINDLVVEIQRYEKLVKSKIPTLPYQGSTGVVINTDGSLSVGDDVLVISEAQTLIRALAKFYLPDGVNN
jgi:hypothetical protein